MKLKILLEAKTAESIYHSDYEDLDALIKADRTGRFICKAGEYWKKFDYKKGLNTLIKVKNSYYIYAAGSNWKNFDYDEGLKALIKNKSFENIYRAGLEWKKFDYKKGLKVLRNNVYYKDALKDWPKGIEVSQAISKRMKNTAKKLPLKRKLKL